MLDASLVAEDEPAVTVAPVVPALPEIENVGDDDAVTFAVQISSLALLRRSVHDGKNEFA